MFSNHIDLFLRISLYTKAINETTIIKKIRYDYPMLLVI